MKRHIYNIFALCTAGLSLASCAGQDSPDHIDDTGLYSMTLTIDPGTLGARGAREFITGEEDGVRFDRMILTGSVNAALYTYSGNGLELAARIEPYYNAAIVTPEGLVLLSGRIVPIIDIDRLKSESVKLMVTANSDFDFDSPESMTFSKGGAFSDFDAIPMWGAKDISLGSLTPGTAFDAGTVDMLRAMAAIEVLWPENLNGAKLVSIRVDNAAESGFAVPSGWNTHLNTSAINNADPFRHKADTGLSTLSTEAADGKARIYLPESLNMADTPVAVNVNYLTGDGEQMSGQILIARYIDGKPDMTTLWNVRRNRIYRFNIVGIPSPDIPGAEFEWEFRINDWLPGDDILIEED